MAAIRFLRSIVLSIFAGTVIAFTLATSAFAMPRTAIDQNISIPNNSYGETTSDTSALNWAGYVATGGTYTSVSGSWIVPTVTTGTSYNVADATWVGIGGVESKDLIQAGTEAIPNSDGTLSYQAWLEILPQDSRIVPLTISPGDSVSVSITETGTNIWQISFDDATTGKTYSTSVNYDSSLSSADWIEEMPVEVNGVVSLDDFGQVNFSSGYTIKNGQAVTIQGSDAQALTMNNSQGEPVATTSAIGEDGSSFAVTRTDAASTPLALSRSGVSVYAAPTSYAVASNYGSYGQQTYVYGAGRGSIRTHRTTGGYRIVVTY